MIMAGMLETASVGPTGHRFTIKGGVVLELRLRGRARATKDIDIVLHDADADLARELERTLTGNEYQGFTFRRKREPILLDNDTVSVEMSVSYRGGAWTSIVVDVARAEDGESEIELVPAIPLTDAFGVTGPATLPCLPLRLHIAQKLHGMTLPPRRGKRNERFKDLVDLLLMESLLVDCAGLLDACESVFRNRDTHDWPPVLELPRHWREPFARMAQEIELPVVDADEAMTRVRSLVERIIAHGKRVG